MEVLLVDDNPLFQELMPALLRRAFGEVEVVPAQDLESAFRRLAHHRPPDLALLDLGLPGNSGITTLRRFRWKFSGVPVAVISATDDAASIRVAREMGVAGYLPKSLNAEAMVQALQQIRAGSTWFPEPPPGAPVSPA